MKKAMIIIVSIIIVLIVGTIIFIECSYKNNMPVLAYHDVVLEAQSDTDIDIDKFESQLKTIKKLGFNTLSMDEFIEWKKNKLNSRKNILLTFDDGKMSFYTNVYPLLKKYNMHATFFVVGSRINTEGYITSEILDELEKSEFVDIESHSYNLHNNESATSDNYDIYSNDMKQYNKYNVYAYPFGINNDNYIKALKDNNFKYAFLFSPGKWANKNQDNYNITRVPIYNSTSYIKFLLKILLNIK